MHLSKCLRPVLALQLRCGALLHSCIAACHADPWMLSAASLNEQRYAETQRCKHKVGTSLALPAESLLVWGSCYQHCQLHPQVLGCGAVLAARHPSVAATGMVSRLLPGPLNQKEWGLRADTCGTRSGLEGQAGTQLRTVSVREHID